MSTFPLGTADEAIVAHELAHQWFGNSTSIAKWEDLWIAEGAATYFEVLWPNRDDPAAFDAEMLAIYDFVAAEESDPRSSSRRRRCSPTGPTSAALPRSTRFGRRSATGRSSASSGPSSGLSRSQRHLAGFHRARGSRERQAVGRSAAACLAVRRAGAGAGRPRRGDCAARGGPGPPAGRSGAPLRAGSASRSAGDLRLASHASTVVDGRQRARPTGRHCRRRAFRVSGGPGAVDFGAIASGDVMHFDLRTLWCGQRDRTFYARPAL